MKLMTLAACAIIAVVTLAVVVRITPTEGVAQQIPNSIDTALRSAERARAESDNMPSPPSDALAESTGEVPANTANGTDSVAATHTPKSSAKESTQPAFTFGNVEFFHRYTNENLHEYTPAGQSDLEAWTDMMTVNRHPNITDQDNLENFANAMLKGFDQFGQVIRVDSFLATHDAPDQYLIVAVLGTPELLEAVFARIMLVDGVGTVMMYAHRIYGHDVGDEMSKWLNEHGSKMEEHLLTWKQLPKFN